MPKTKISSKLNKALKWCWNFSTCKQLERIISSQKLKIDKEKRCFYWPVVVQVQVCMSACTWDRGGSSKNSLSYARISAEAEQVRYSPVVAVFLGSWLSNLRRERSAASGRACLHAVEEEHCHPSSGWLCLLLLKEEKEDHAGPTSLCVAGFLLVGGSFPATSMEWLWEHSFTGCDFWCRVSGRFMEPLQSGSTHWGAERPGLCAVRP